MKQYETPVLHRMDVTAADVLMTSPEFTEKGEAEVSGDVVSGKPAGQSINAFQ